MLSPRGAGVRVGASGGAAAASGITIGTTTITGGATTQVLYNLGGVVQSTGTLLINATAGQGPSIVAGTATTDVAALSVTRTNNNAAVVKGVEIVYTDTTSAAGFLPFQVLGGAAGTTNLFQLSKVGNVHLSQGGTEAVPNISLLNTNTGFYSTGSGTNLLVSVGGATIAGFLNNGGTRQFVPTNGGSTADIGGTGLHWRSVFASNYYGQTKPIILATAPTIASGGCTSPTVTNTNGTAFITIDVGTSCSGSQPIVLTMPAATTGWNCVARNMTNGATSNPRQTGAVSTTGATITNFAATTGLAAAWTDGDDLQISCLGG